MTTDVGVFALSSYLYAWHVNDRHSEVSVSLCGHGFLVAVMLVMLSRPWPSYLYNFLTRFWFYNVLQCDCLTLALCHCYPNIAIVTLTTCYWYQGVCHWNNLPLEIKQCPSKDTFKCQVKCLLYCRLFVQETSTFLILTIGCFLHILSDDCNKYYVPCYFQWILF